MYLGLRAVPRTKRESTWTSSGSATVARTAQHNPAQLDATYCGRAWDRQYTFQSKQQRHGFLTVESNKWDTNKCGLRSERSIHRCARRSAPEYVTLFRKTLASSSAYFLYISIFCSRFKSRTIYIQNSADRKARHSGCRFFDSKFLKFLQTKLDSWLESFIGLDIVLLVLFWTLLELGDQRVPASIIDFYPRFA